MYKTFPAIICANFSFRSPNQLPEEISKPEAGSQKCADYVTLGYNNDKTNNVLGQCSKNK